MLISRQTTEFDRKKIQISSLTIQNVQPPIKHNHLLSGIEVTQKSQPSKYKPLF